MLVVVLIPTIVLGTFAISEWASRRDTADDAAAMREAVLLVEASELMGVPLVVEHSAAYALDRAQQAGAAGQLELLLRQDGTNHTMDLARAMLDSALDGLADRFGSVQLPDGRSIGVAVADARTALATAREAFDDRRAGDLTSYYSIVIQLARQIDELTDATMEDASTTKELGHLYNQVQVFESAMELGALALLPVVDSAITGNTGTTLVDEVAASGSFKAALDHLAAMLPPDQAARLAEIRSGPNFATVGAAEPAWLMSVALAGDSVDEITASDAAIEAISDLYEARALSLLELHEFGASLLDAQKSTAEAIESDARSGVHRTVIWVSIAIGGNMVLLLLILASVLMPLRALDRHTRQVREGDLALAGATLTGPTEVRSVTATFNEMVATLNAFHSQVDRLAHGDTVGGGDLPGPLGAAVRDSVRRLADLTDQLHRSEAEAVRLSLTDTLTGLANRAAVLQHLERLAAGSDERAHPAALIYLDLDGFKSVNDSQGHAAGDRILREIGQRLQLQRPQDMVARMGGDEFIVVVEDVIDAMSVRTIAESLITVIGEPCSARDGEQFTLSASAGVTTVRPGDDPLECVARADFAVYRAKELGRSRVETFDESLAAEREIRSEMALKMRQGLADGDFRLVFQPIIDLRTGHTVAFEALLRWRRTDGLEVSPTEFIPLAERTGVILAIDEWVINTAVKVLSEWEADAHLRDLRLAVNISGRHVVDGTLAAHLRTSCGAAGVSPSRIEVEITETYLMADPPRAKEVIDEIRAMGVRVAIDDFGTGYSSMSSLHDLRTDQLKIDKLFIDGVTRGEVDRTIVELVVRLADSLGIATVAEGVDSEEKLAELRRLGCTLAQGFHLAPPMELGDVATWVLAHDDVLTHS